jgi:glycosyltransferase involved in cell wall biosynthesis
MATVIAGLLASSLARRYRLEALPTYRSSAPLVRAATFSRALVRLVAWCLSRGPRLVHVHATVRGSMYRKAVCVATAKALRRPVLLHVHAGAAEIEVFRRRLGPLRAALLRGCLARADRIVTVSRAGRTALERSFGLSGVGVVPNAAPPTASRSPKARPGAEVEILYLGGFANPVKGGDVLVRALGTVLEAVPTIRVTLAGPGEPPAAAQALLIRHPSVQWLGWLDELGRAQAFGSSDVFVLPSTSEGLPMAVLEAMAEGLAIVATEMGGVPDILSDEVDALLVPPADAEALARTMLRLAGDAALRERLATRALARARRLSEEEVSGRLDETYAELLADVIARDRHGDPRGRLAQ